MSATILPFKGKPQEPEVFSRNDVKVMLVLTADLVSDIFTGGLNVEKDLELYNDIQDYLLDLDIPDKLTKAELLHILDDIIEEFECFSDVRSTYSMVKDDLHTFGYDTKRMLLDAFGQQRGKALHIPEIHGELPDGPGF